MTAPTIDPNVTLSAAMLADVCDADLRHRYPLASRRLRAGIRVYGDVLPGDDRDEFDPWGDDL